MPFDSTTYLKPKTRPRRPLQLKRWTEDSPGDPEQKGGRGTLPAQISDLVRIAAEDYRKAIADPRTRINMDNWALPAGNYSETRMCYVCVAGAVMLGHLGWDPFWNQSAAPGDYKMWDAARLHAIDDIRSGGVLRAISRIYRDGGEASSRHERLAARVVDRFERWSRANGMPERHQGFRCKPTIFPISLPEEFERMADLLAEEGI